MGVRDNSMTPRIYKIRKVKSFVETVWENPKSRLLENHYKFLRKILRSQYKSIDNLSDELIEDLCQTIVYADRILRKKRQGKQNQLKEKLATEFKKEL